MSQVVSGDNPMDKLIWLDEQRQHFIGKAHRVMDLMFLASLEQKTDTVHHLSEEISTYVEIVWRYDGKRDQLLKELDGQIQDFPFGGDSQDRDDTVPAGDNT